MSLNRHLFLAAVGAFATVGCDELTAKCGGDTGSTCGDSGLTGTGETPTTGTTEGYTYGGSGVTEGFYSYTYSYSGN